MLTDPLDNKEFGTKKEKIALASWELPGDYYRIEISSRDTRTTSENYLSVRTVLNSEKGQRYAY
jgi:hypothetical protein